jgi:hypothetical protein
MPSLRRLPATRGKRMTSVELPPELLKEARLHAAAYGITLRELIEEALRHRLAQKEDTMTTQRTRRRREGMP